MRNMPALDSGGAAAGGAANPQLNSAIEQFTAPLVRFATGGQPVASDIQQLIESIPNFVVNVPGLGDVDISKLDPALISHVLRGGQIPGIPKETLDKIVQQYMLKMHEAAAAAKNGTPLPNSEKFLPSLDKLPQELIAAVIQGDTLPGLNETETETIKEYYTHLIPIMATDEEVTNETNAVSPPPPSKRPAFVFSKEMMDMLKMLPAGYDLTKIPAEIITAFSRGEVPDLRKLPEDLLEHFKSNSDKLGLIFNRVATGNASLEEMLSKLPKFEKPVLSTFSPYDINRLSNDMVHEEEEAAKAAQMKIYTAIALGLVGALTIVVLGFFAVYIKRQRRGKERCTTGELHHAPYSSQSIW
ncbi:hypothetical protein OESDEN_04493 [Oesophagostomum dentatum]|uniref:Uncharacterized protein n=1 Tax=Oesophagostomum dentatum TaxID=61180 RepID=A0A0B1THI3_OESDE|nr:hypothetical protein OESDEN_04493 [Oesophagostomum dentatum]